MNLQEVRENYAEDPQTLRIAHIAMDFSKLCEAHRIELRPYDIPALEWFSKLDCQVKEDSIKKFESYLNVCISASSSGLSLRDTSRLLQFTLRHFGLKAPSRLYDLLEDDDLVEAYNSAQLQIFRSVQFLEICNYTLVDVLCNQWFNLYERDSGITKIILDYAERAATLDTDVRPVRIPKHLMIEKFAQPRGVFETEITYMAPLFAGPNWREGFVSIIKARVLGQKEIEQSVPSILKPELSTLSLS